MAEPWGQSTGEVQGLAEVINSPSLAKAATVTVSPPDVSPDMARLLGSHGIAVCVKKHQGSDLSVCGADGAQPGQGEVPGDGHVGQGTIRAIGEDRTIPLHDGRFEDGFAPYAVHLYEVVP